MFLNAALPIVVIELPNFKLLFKPLQSLKAESPIDRIVLGIVSEPVKFDLLLNAPDATFVIL